jgi:ribonuclease VapC
MAVDSSALIAIVNGEREREAFAEAIRQSERALCSAFSLHQTAAVLMVQKSLATARDAEALAEKLGLEIVAFTREQMSIAIEAYARHRQGMGKQPFLNLGDCVSYALAKSLDVPLLYKGEDFGVTDVEPVLRTKIAEN